MQVGISSGFIAQKMVPDTGDKAHAKSRIAGNAVFDVFDMQVHALACLPAPFPHVPLCSAVCVLFVLLVRVLAWHARTLRSSCLGPLHGSWMSLAAHACHEALFFGPSPPFSCPTQARALLPCSCHGSQGQQPRASRVPFGDGGGSDNLAVYPALRRRVPRLVVCSANKCTPDDPKVRYTDHGSTDHNSTTGAVVLV